MDIEIYQVDAFTNETFKGNPAGVCITKETLSEDLMLSIAAEMAVSETAFLSLNNMNLKWFTPQAEVKLCGHGTLSATHILKEKKLFNVNDTVTFNTLSGSLTALIKPSTIELDFPAPILDFNITPSTELLASIGIEATHIIAYGIFDSKIFIEVDDEEIVLNLAPNFDRLTKIDGRGVLITAPTQHDDLDFISRFFAPWVGVNEDPVTGSAHCALTLYWSEKLNKVKLNGYQASARGGYVSTELLPNGRIKLIGSAITTIKGTMQLPNI
ncbi:PhzF family phenazine biosynthesis protein [Photobacterium angustum]|uniref:PhzF family phenazine biosynthesis protein n=1 Tax=Photobacterium angustum TaxID=661 RepID=A0A855SEB4_PHOAN|nr:PhzF family phenazine biosynthesis protein [Photobacterium angustum]KJG17434.1 phenazine biosynthesis protein PhzF [Photobacterium angustum]KJG23902.1 phenazine biosynthesis protein PhzF [Photobacterium angustum]KJG31414.1 phenazine biosynthesis protein PhzF [Photobacterium angustum]KJG42598.1 phenazine biosynthesis protein PhzF [Photobacterium angustum]KJG49899.1 phenazine biosynthesis protein PhzF [Photobacterium angustum]